MRRVAKEQKNVKTLEKMETLKRIDIASPTTAATALINGNGIAAGPFIESFRLLALNLSRMLEGLDRRSILVVSGLPGDGRSITATGLARALADIAEPVLLLDADPVGSGTPAAWDRSPSPAVNGSSSRFQIDGKPGLYSYIPRAGKRAQSAFLADVIEALDRAADERMTTVVDTPACLHSTIAFGLAPHVGGVIYVARPNAGHRPPHAEIRNQLDLLGANVLGVVVNEG